MCTVMLARNISVVAYKYCFLRRQEWPHVYVPCSHANSVAFPTCEGKKRSLFLFICFFSVYMHKKFDKQTNKSLFTTNQQPRQKLCFARQFILKSSCALAFCHEPLQHVLTFERSVFVPFVRALIILIILFGKFR